MDLVKLQEERTMRNFAVCFLILLLGCIPAITSAQNTKITELITQLNQTKDELNKIALLKQIGLEYKKNDVYKKAIVYYEQAYRLEKKHATQAQQLQTMEYLALFHTQTRNYAQAIALYQQLYKAHKVGNNYPKAMEALIQSGDLHKQKGNFEKAIDTKLEVIAFAQQIKDTPAEINASINVGFLYKQTGNNAKSMEYYQKALALSQRTNVQDKARYQTKILINQGVAYSQVGNFEQASVQFDKALDLSLKQKNQVQTANVYNYMAANHYINGKNKKALGEVKKAVQLAQTSGNKRTLATSYEIMAKVYEQEEKFKESQKYYQLQQQLKNQFKDKARAQQENILQKEINAEKMENNLRQLLADKDRQAAALKQAKLEKEKRDKELALLRKNRALEQAELKNQQLEKQRVEQLLALAEQKAIAERRKQETEKQKLLTITERVKKEKAEADRKKAEADKEKEQKARQVVEAQKALQDQELKQEKQLRYYGLGIIGLGIVVLVLTMIGFVNIRRTARQLRKKNIQIEEQKTEIVTQNEELHQQQEELAAQRDFAAQKSIELDKQNQQVKKSIVYASNIQNALLPTSVTLAQHFPEHFIIFHPKDIVSGDFYWFSEIDQQKVLAVVDCTGHGVPGAFMSMIGNTVFNEIVNEKRITDPAEMLQRLHLKVREGLKQHDSKNTDGMDVCLCRFADGKQPGQTIVTYTGAKRNLYYVHQGELGMLKGDRVSIGGHQHEKKRVFTNKQITLDSGDTLYLSSDGFVDTPSPQRKSFGTGRFEKTLLACAQKSMQDQRAYMEETRKEFQKNAEQRDDILVIGVRV